MVHTCFPTLRKICPTDCTRRFYLVADPSHAQCAEYPTDRPTISGPECAKCRTDRPTSGGPECAECVRDRPTVRPTPGRECARHGERGRRLAGTRLNPRVLVAFASMGGAQSRAAFIDSDEIDEALRLAGRYTRNEIHNPEPLAPLANADSGLLANADE